MISANLMGDATARDRLRAVRKTAAVSVARTITKLGLNLQNNVQQSKLSGQVLRTHSGSLKQSIGIKIDQSETVVGATVYSNLNYATTQEYGFSGTVTVRASLRQIKEAFGKPIAAEIISVGRYSRRMNLSQRSFLRSALGDMTPDISAGVEDAIGEALS